MDNVVPAILGLAYFFGGGVILGLADPQRRMLAWYMGIESSLIRMIVFLLWPVLLFCWFFCWSGSDG